MIKYIFKRILLMIPVIVAASSLVFFLMHFAPGDPARIILGEGAQAEAIAAKRTELGLDDPLIVQYGRFVYKTFVKFDLGESYKTGRPIMGEIAERYPLTMKLCLVGTLALTLIGIPIGVLSGVKRGKFIDHLMTSLAYIGVSMPEFWTALLFCMIFALKLKWLPATGSYGPKYWILPGITIALHSSANLLKTTRSSMLDVIGQDYIRTARAKGQSESKIIWTHEFTNAMIPIITVMGFRVGQLLGGSVVIESIFSIPGMGKYMLEGINNRDYAVVQACALILCITFCAINLIVDILYAFVDPRIRARYQGKKKEKIKEDNNTERKEATA